MYLQNVKDSVLGFGFKLSSLDKYDAKSIGFLSSIFKHKPRLAMALNT